MFKHYVRAQQFVELIRFYQAALVNTGFGLSVFMIFISVGVELYLAQIISHLIGMAFNYFTYSRHVFRDALPAKIRFLFAYFINYVLGVAVLYVVTIFIVSPYIAVIMTVAITSIVNFALLKYAVFTKSVTDG